jgi:ribosomal protein S18 acetylase RimI-like enzyme
MITPKLPDGFEFVAKDSITPSDVIYIREEDDTPEQRELWQQCLDESLYVIGVKEMSTDQLVGIGFVAGNARHAELVDGTVHTQYRRRGIGRALIADRLAFVTTRAIPYVTIQFDVSKPWLRAYYESCGFSSIDYAMKYNPQSS